MFYIPSKRKRASALFHFLNGLSTEEHFEHTSCFAHSKKPEKFTINNQLVAAQKSQKWVSHAKKPYIFHLFVRRKTNKSGTISVRVVSKHRGQYKVERSFGTCRTESEVVRLEEQAIAVRSFYHCIKNRIEGHICICFTACTIVLETERMLKKHLPNISLKRAQELVKTMYRLTYRLPNSRETHTKVLGMSDKQLRLFEIVGRWCR